MTLRPEFVHSASPEAIQAELDKARATRRRWERECKELERLYATRQAQIQRGEWPPCGHEAQGLLLHGQRCVLAPHKTGDHQGPTGDQWENQEET